MRYIDEQLEILRECLETDSYQAVEESRLELKDLSTTGNWDELYKTICAFLNTEGGIIVIGIKEKEKSYRFTGFNDDNEAKLKEQLHQKFTDERVHPFPDLANYFPPLELVSFYSGRVAIVYVEKLPEVDRFVYYKGKAYQRKGTGDHEIDAQGIQLQEELKRELRYAQELEFVPKATLESLNIDKLNEYIGRLNRSVKVETLKADLEKAMPFLTRKEFVRDGKPTLLGMLVCGENLEDFIGGRCEVDCSVESKSLIADNKQVLKENIIDLMEDTLRFVLKNLQQGISYEKGGSRVFEYPIELLRENINNALAHRDYRSNRFVIVKIRPNQNIEFRNPGAFQERQTLHLDTTPTKIRRIIPTQHSRNPRLTDILKSFDRWEGEGRGLASLTNACLDNNIDLPYYLLGDEIRLIVPKGKIYDDKMAQWLQGFNGYIGRKYGRELNDQEKIMMCYCYKSELANRMERYTVLLTADNNHTELIANLEEKGLLFKQPDCPKIYPVYLVDRVLVQTTFDQPLFEIFDKAFNELKPDYKEILTFIYQTEKFGDSNRISANFIAHSIFIRRHGPISDVAEYEKYRAKVRQIVTRLEKNQFIVRKDGKAPDFQINLSYQKSRLTL